MTANSASNRLLAWLDSAPNREQTGDFAGLKLAAIRAVLARLPAPPAPCTVAGTKGKGSTLRMIEAALNALGLATVAFTSPHVRDVHERWRIAGNLVDPEVAWNAAERVMAAESAAGAPLTWFERTFALACVLAADRPEAVFLVEVGIGGRLDCANALDARVAVLTHLSHDHRDLLGPTLHHIAAEKLAIARPGRPLVVAPQTPAAALAVWRQMPPGVEARFVQPPALPFALALDGDHQQDNAATALAAVQLLVPGCSAATARHGLAEARLAARCQLVETAGRRLLIDGAHNGPSVAATLEVARHRLKPGWRLILALAKDKEIDEVLAAIPLSLQVTRCGYASPRSRRRDDWPTWAGHWRWCDDVASAIAAQPPDADLCITGSFYLAGEALAAVASADRLPG
ncbi:hypothetical protein LBMAG53_16770 [Planctomycetota bacterium]|nr:hypothetical protein LBMAG53_16770 [Planctomycetota bacterium]